MSFLEQLLLMFLLGARRDDVIAARLLWLPPPEGYFYVYGATVFGCDWPKGLWYDEES